MKEEKLICPSCYNKFVKIEGEGQGKTLYCLKCKNTFNVSDIFCPVCMRPKTMLVILKSKCFYNFCEHCATIQDFYLCPYHNNRFDNKGCSLNSETVCSGLGIKAEGNPLALTNGVLHCHQIDCQNPLLPSSYFKFTEKKKIVSDKRLLKMFIYVAKGGQWPTGLRISANFDILNP